jgi:hypothetical protein
VLSSQNTQLESISAEVAGSMYVSGDWSDVPSMTFEDLMLMTADKDAATADGVDAAEVVGINELAFSMKFSATNRLEPASQAIESGRSETVACFGIVTGVGGLTIGSETALHTVVRPSCIQICPEFWKLASVGQLSFWKTVQST